MGRIDEARQESKRALELDPVSSDIRSTLARTYYYSRDYDRAIKEYRKIIELFPDNNYLAQEWLSVVLVQKGLYDEAIKEIPKVELYPSIPWHIGYTYAAAGEKEKAKEILDYFLELSTELFVPPINIAFIYIGLGEIDKAFEWLEIAYEQKEAWLDNIQSGPMFDNLRSDPRFQDLVDRMDFPEY
jgi:tetratricopeptide (TPR) repeat protein